MELRGKLLEPYFTATMELVVPVQIAKNQQKDALAGVDDLRDKDLDVRICRHREKRSLDANSYCWVLLTAIADVIRSSKEEVYVELLKRYGQGGVVKIPNDGLSLFLRTYKYTEKHESLPDEERAQYYKFWLGSSEYSKSEMSVFIDGVVSEAKDLGIQTETPDEIAKMKARWADG